MLYTLTSTPFLGVLPQAQADSVYKLLEEYVQEGYADHEDDPSQLIQTLHQYSGIAVYIRPSGVADIFVWEKECPGGCPLQSWGYVYPNGKHSMAGEPEFYNEDYAYNCSASYELEFNENGELIAV